MLGSGTKTRSLSSCQFCRGGTEGCGYDNRPIRQWLQKLASRKLSRSCAAVVGYMYICIISYSNFCKHTSTSPWLYIMLFYDMNRWFEKPSCSFWRHNVIIYNLIWTLWNGVERLATLMICRDWRSWAPTNGLLPTPGAPFTNMV